MYEPWNVSKYREQNIDPKLQAKTHFQEYANWRDDD
jgi:hypothetical protein